MLDYKTETFITLCEVMNYRKTAEILNMTQPAVTQHIHALEEEYNCSLFIYDRRKLTKTRQAAILEQHLRKVRYDEKTIRSEMLKENIPDLRLGATKSIGDYMISDKIIHLITSDECRVHLLVENTKILLEHIRNGVIDVAMVEGEFDKNTFGTKLMKSEEFLGICSKDCALAERVVEFDEAASYNLIIREYGSGSRNIFENQLKTHSESINSFANVSYISSLNIIRDIVANNLGITFGYKSIVNGDPRLSTFRIKGFPKAHDLYYVYLKGSHAANIISKYLLNNEIESQERA